MIDMMENAPSGFHKPNSQILVTADIHSVDPPLERSDSTSIEIHDSDSFIIDLEDIDSVTPSSKFFKYNPQQNYNKCV
jgi:hypothetical protein